MRWLLGIITHGWRTWRLTAAQKLAWKWKRDSIDVLRGLTKAARRIEKLKERVLEESKRVSSLVEETERLIEEHDHVEEALNRELTILKDVALPGLALAHEMTRGEMEADIAMHARHRAVMQPEPNRE